MHPLLAGFLLAWGERTPYAKEPDLVLPSSRLKGREPLSASIFAQEYLRPAAIKAGALEEGQRARFVFHNFLHSLASALVKMKIDPKTVQQSDMESMRDAQGKFLEQLRETGKSAGVYPIEKPLSKILHNAIVRTTT